MTHKAQNYSSTNPFLFHLAILFLVVAFALGGCVEGDEVLPTEPPPPDADPAQVTVGGTCTTELTEGGFTARIICRDESFPEAEIERVRWELTHGSILVASINSDAGRQVTFEADLETSYQVRQTVFTEDGRQIRGDTYTLETPSGGA